MAGTTVFDPKPDFVSSDTTKKRPVTPQEQALFFDPKTRHVWWAPLRRVLSDGWTAVNSGLLATPAHTSGGAAALPSNVADGGPDGARFVQGAAADPVGVLRTAANAIVTAEPWTIWAVAKAGATTATGAFGIVGNGGGGLVVVLRTSDLCRVFTSDAAGAETQLLSAPATSAAWHLVALAHDPTSNLLSLYIDGVLAIDGTHDLTLGSSRFCLFGGHDLTVDVDTEGRGLGIVGAGILKGSIAADAALKTTLEAAVLSRMPTLF